MLTWHAPQAKVYRAEGNEPQLFRQLVIFSRRVLLRSDACPLACAPSR